MLLSDEEGGPIHRNTGEHINILKMTGPLIYVF